MHEAHLEYRIEEGLIGADVPYNLFHKVAGSSLGGGLRDILTDSEHQYARVESGHNGIFALRFDLGLIARTIHNDDDIFAPRDRKLNGVIDTFNGLSAMGDYLENGDPRLPDVHMSTEITSHDRLSGFILTRPSLPDDLLARAATEAMGTGARQLEMGYPYDTGALIDRNGMEFVANPIASATIGTDGMEYSHGSPRIELYSHNLYTPTMQLVCFSGIIAVLEEERRAKLEKASA